MYLGATQTRYKEMFFPSQLEARWACFYDALGVEWEYQLEGFKIPFTLDLPSLNGFLEEANDRYPDVGMAWGISSIGGRDAFLERCAKFQGKTIWYLPDFYFPEFNLWGDTNSVRYYPLLGALKITAFFQQTDQRIALFERFDIPLGLGWISHEKEPIPVTFRKNRNELERAIRVAKSVSFGKA